MDNNKFFNRANWLTAIIGLFTGVVGMIASSISLGILYYAFTVTAQPTPLTPTSYSIFVRGIIFIIMAGIMITNTHKFRRGMTVSKSSYYFLLIYLVVDTIAAFIIGSPNSVDMIYRSILPILTVFALINLYKGARPLSTLAS